jgi:hypothetical protein
MFWPDLFGIEQPYNATRNCRPNEVTHFETTNVAF